MHVHLSEVDGSDSSLSATASGTSTDYVTSPEIEDSTQKTLTKPSLDNLRLHCLQDSDGLESVAKQLQKLLFLDSSPKQGEQRQRCAKPPSLLTLLPLYKPFPFLDNLQPKVSTLAHISFDAGTRTERDRAL